MLQIAIGALLSLCCWFWGYFTGCKKTEDIRQRVTEDFLCRPSRCKGPRVQLSASEQIIQKLEKQGAWLIKFRFGEDTAVLLCSQPCKSQHPGQQHVGLSFRRYVFGSIVGPKRWLNAAQQVFSEPVANRRDLYFCMQTGGKVIVVQRPQLTSVGGKVVLEDEMMCWHNVVFDTFAESVTLDKEPTVIV